MSTAELQQAVHGSGYDTYTAYNQWNTMYMKRKSQEWKQYEMKAFGFLSLFSWYQCTRLSSLSRSGKGAVLVGATILPIFYISNGFVKRL